MEMSDLRLDSLSDHPKFVAAYNDFKRFLDLTLKDLEQKHQSLRAERKALGKTQQTIKNYLDCQAFMINHHIRRLEFFRLEVDSRLAEILGRDDRIPMDRLDSVGSDGSRKSWDQTDSSDSRLDSPDSGSLPDAGSSPESSRIGSPDSRTDSIPSPPPPSSSSNLALRQLMADMKTMKRRVKHVLDVTDRYSVVAKDGEDVQDERRTSSRPTSPLPEVVRQHVVKSTVNSFCSHLAVIAKTYTRRTSHDPTEMFETA